LLTYLAADISVWMKKCMEYMKWRVPDQEVDQTGLGERLYKKIVKPIK